MSDPLVFLLSAAAVGGAGMRLAWDGDAIAERTGLGGLWVGAILVAAATSLPEVATNAHAVLQGSRDLAVGALFGSCMANLAILAGADLATRRLRILTRVAVNQALVGILGVCLVSLAAVDILLGSDRSLLGLGAGAWLVGFVYLAGMRLLHRNRGEPPFRPQSEVPPPAEQPSRLIRPVVGFGLSALVILVGAPYLASSSAALAVRLGIGEGFAGMILLAVTTSFPELAVTYTCIRAGWHDLAVGNLLGSNCFNIAAIVPLDVLDGAGALLGEIDRSLVIAALVSILMTSLATLDILNKSERRLWFVEPGPAAMLAAYFLGLAAVYLTEGAR